jgi:isoquinoline 1-oxidoreductase alpha subunit
MAFSIEVNGKAHLVDVDHASNSALLEPNFLPVMPNTSRNTQRSGVSRCTVHLDGAAIRSCITPIDSVGTSQITTIIVRAARDAHEERRGRSEPGQARIEPTRESI